MKTYIEKLYGELHELSTQPVCRRSVEEAAEIAELICVLEKLERKCDFTEADAHEWTARMENTDDTTGPHWPMEQTTAVMVSKGYHYDPAVWYAAMNMIYSDYFKTAKKHGVNTVEFYADMAEAFLDDKDAGGPEEKISAYYHCIAS
nr:MAG TPA: hypothetical protein [Caudoviricetes sp.]